ncbi:MAG: hypothetical protein EON59_13015 [Alphaproteobacteria bacterium]|nr:MAG: hypothetical protein EON59_13015 [Alphaproteobacteria bacterium]
MQSAITIDVDTIRSLLRLLHFVGLALGLGTATFLDLMLLRFMLRGRVRKRQLQIFTFGSHAVAAGLVLLWVSGGALIWLHSVVSPETLANPKIWAKISVVWVLTLNAVFLHLLVLPMFRKQAGRLLLDDLSSRDRCMMVVGGVTSAVSWYFPLVIAAQTWLNFRVPVAQILGTYVAILALALLAGLTVSVVVARRHNLARRRSVDLGIDAAGSTETADA